MEKVTTPKGELQWVIITGEGKENLNGTLQYKADILLDPSKNAEHKEFLKKIETFWEENKPKGFKKAPKSLGWYLADLVVDKNGEPVLDKDGEKQYVPIEKGGRVRVSFKTAVTYPDGKPKAVKVYNSKAARVDLGETLIGNGSIGRLGGMLAIYEVKDRAGKTVIDAGVTFFLDGVMVIKLVKYEGGGPAFDADDEEDGFTGIGEDEDFEGTAPAAASKGQPRL